MLNHIVTMGRFVRDPELRHTQAGIPVCSFTIACDRDYKNTNGEKDTDFIDIVAWRNTAEFVSNRLQENRETYHTISSALGHTSPDSAAVYVKTDIELLRECALDPTEVGL